MLSNGAIGLKSECGTWILEAAKGDNWRQFASDKRRHIATNSLPPFAARFRAAFFPNDFVRRWCLTKLPAFQFQKAATNQVRLNI